LQTSRPRFYENFRQCRPAQARIHAAGREITRVALKIRAHRQPEHMRLPKFPRTGTSHTRTGTRNMRTDGLNARANHIFTAPA